LFSTEGRRLVMWSRASEPQASFYVYMQHGAMGRVTGQWDSSTLGEAAAPNAVVPYLFFEAAPDWGQGRSEKRYGTATGAASFSVFRFPILTCGLHRSRSKQLLLFVAYW